MKKLVILVVVVLIAVKFCDAMNSRLNHGKSNDHVIEYNCYKKCNKRHF